MVPYYSFEDKKVMFECLQTLLPGLAFNGKQSFSNASKSDVMEHTNVQTYAVVVMSTDSSTANAQNIKTKMLNTS